MRTRKWKHKEGRDSSHSYWSRTYGPRGTTHGTSGRRPWRWMVSRRGFLLRQGAGAASPGSPNLETTVVVIQRGVREYEICFQGFLLGGKNRGQRGHREGPQGSQEAPWRALGWGRAREPSGVPVVALLSFLGVSEGFRDADFLYNVSGIFGAL